MLDEISTLRPTADDVRSLREKWGLKQGEFGRILGLSNVTISAYECNKSWMTVAVWVYAQVLFLKSKGMK